MDLETRMSPPPVNRDAKVSRRANIFFLTHCIRGRCNPEEGVKGIEDRRGSEIGESQRNLRMKKSKRIADSRRA